MATMTMGATVIYKENGDVGKVVECDSQGRDRLVSFRNGCMVWVYKDELYEIEEAV